MSVRRAVPVFVVLACVAGCGTQAAADARVKMLARDWYMSRTAGTHTVYDFAADGTFKATFWRNSPAGPEQTALLPGTWTLSGDTLTVKLAGPDGTTDWTIVSLTDDALTLRHPGGAEFKYKAMTDKDRDWFQTPKK